MTRPIRPAAARPLGVRRPGGLMVPGFAVAAAVLVTTEFIVVGLLPVLARDMGVPLDRAGWLVAAFALSAAVAGPVVTLAAGRWPPRLVLTLVLAVFGIGNLIAALLPGFAVMVVARSVQGALLTQFISLASAMAASVAGQRSAGRAIGQVNMGLVVGLVAAVPAGVALADLAGWRVVFAVLGASSVASAGLVLALTPRAPAGAEASPIEQTGILRDGRFLAQLAVSALLFTAMFAAYSYIAAFLEDVVGLAGTDVALALFGFGLAGIVGNWLAARAVDRDPLGLTIAVAAILVLATGTMSLAGVAGGAAVVLLAVWGAAHMAAFVACQVRVMFAAPSAPAFAAALNISVCNLGIAAGAALGGWTVTRLGSDMIGLPAAAAGAVALAVGLALRRRRPTA